MNLDSLIESNVSEIQEIVDGHTSFPEEVDKILESNIKDLMDVDLSGITNKLEKRISELKALTEKIVEKRRSVVSNLREEKKKRDALNEEVQRAAKKVRQLIKEREKVNDLLDEKHERLDEIREQMKNKEKKLEELKEDLEGFSMQKKRKIESKLDRVNWSLQTRSLPENIEERLVNLSVSLEKKLKKYEKKAKNFKKIKQLKKKINELKQEKKAIKSGLAAYYKEEEELTDRIHKFAKERNEKKDKADKNHQQFIEYAKRADELNALLSKIKQTKIQLIQTLRKIRSLKSEKREIKEKERLQEVMKGKVASIRQKLTERGSIDFEDLSFLLEHGFLSDEIIQEFPNMGQEEKREKILTKIEDQVA